MKRIPMILQFAVILFFVMAIPTTVLYAYSGTQILHQSEIVIADSALAELKATFRLNEKALSNLSKAVVRFASTNSAFRTMKNLLTYQMLNTNYDNVNNARILSREMQNIASNDEGVHSIYFLLEDADYVISSDYGIVRLDAYEPVAWMDEALIEQIGIGGVWFPRRLQSGKSVISFVLPLNRLTTSTRGTIVANLLESEVSSHLSSPASGARANLLLEPDGMIISATDKSLLFTDGRALPYVAQALDSVEPFGYGFYSHDGERILYTWQRSDRTEWTYINAYSMDQMLAQTLHMRKNIILLTVAILIVGTALVTYLATWLSRPVRELVQVVRGRGDLKVADKNEMAFLHEAFRQIQEEEEALHKLLREREQDSRNLTVHGLLRDDVLQPQYQPVFTQMFPLRCFMVAIASIDNYTQYVGNTNPETRSYHRYLFITQSETLFPPDIHVHGVYRGEGAIALVINFDVQERDNGCERIQQALLATKESAKEILGHTVTVGVSSIAEGSAGLRESALEALDAMKGRMAEGSDRLFFWRAEAKRGKKYFYPANSERRILNYLKAGDLDHIVEELKAVHQQILGSDYISYDNILFIYNQLVGATIKYLGENNISIGRIFAERGNLYATIASIDTLVELEEYLTEFFGEIIQYLSADEQPGEVKHGERVLRYLDMNYREDILFEDLAQEMGISYSYMRKLVREMTGKSLIDYLNLLRIQEAKRMLKEQDTSITQIAIEVGYRNVQSFNRFFRKYEGVSPSEYRTNLLE